MFSTAYKKITKFKALRAQGNPNEVFNITIFEFYFLIFLKHDK